MSDKTVKFTINVGGNAVSGIVALTKKVSTLGAVAGNVTDVFRKFGNFGMRLAGVISSIQAINAKAEEFINAYNSQIEAESKLERVMRNTMGARSSEIQSVKALASAQQRLGVIGDEVQLAGAQELGTYLSKTSTLKKLMPVMNDMLAQQYGLNASQEQAAQIASMLGKVMDGQVGALSRYGYKFTKEQEKILKFGSEEQRAAVLAKVVGDAVGGMNKALAKTSAGKVKQLANSWGDLKESVGALANKIQVALVPVASNLIRKLQGIVEVPLPQQIAREKVELNALVGALIENYDKEDERKRLIDEIQAKYPDFLKNIDLEKTSTEDLKKALKGVNEEYDKRIRKAAYERRIEALEKEEANSEDSVLKYEMALRAQQDLADLMKKGQEAVGRMYGVPAGAQMNWYAGKVTVQGSDGVTSPVTLLPGDQATVEQLMADYKNLSELAGGNMTSVNKKKLEKAKERYKKYKRQKEYIKQLVDAEFGTESEENTESEEKPGDGGTSGIVNAASAGVEAAVTGGTRSTTVNISLGKMIEQVVFNGSWEESSAELESKVQECLYRVLALAATV